MGNLLPTMVVEKERRRSWGDVLGNHLRVSRLGSDPQRTRATQGEDIQRGRLDRDAQR